MKSWLLTYEARPWLLNAERSGGGRGVGGHFGRAALVSEWREAFAQLALVHHLPPLEWVSVEFLQICRDRRMPDIGNCFPAAKAALDGLVDAGIIPDDKDPYVQHFGFVPPQNLGYNALAMRVEGPVMSRPPRPLRSGTPAKNRVVLR